MASLGDLIVRIGANIAEFDTAMSKVSSQLEDVGKKAEKAFQGFERLGSQLMSLGAGMTAAITLPIAGVGLAALKAAGEMEQMEVGFKTLLGSGEAATKMMGDLRQFAATTPFQFPELVTAAQRLMAMGTAADKIIPTMTAIGNAVSAMGKGMPEFERISLAYSQMSNSAKLSAADMKQFTEAGIKGWKYLSDATGISMKEIQDKAKDVLTGAQAAQIILQGMTRDFAGAMVEQSKTMLGLWSNVGDAMKFTLADIGKTLLPVAKQITTDFIFPMLDAIKGMAETFANLPGPVQKATLALTALAAVAGPLLVALGAMSSGFGTVMTGLKTIGGVLGMIGPAVSGMATSLGMSTLALTGWAAAIAAAVAALIAFGVWVYDNWEPIKATLLQAWDGLSKMWQWAWNGVTDFLSGIWQAISDAAKAILEPVASFLGGIWDAVKEAWNAAWDGVAGWLSGIWQGLVDFVRPAWEPVKEFFAHIWDGIKETFAAVWNAIKNTLIAAWNAIGSVAGGVWNKVTSAISSFIEWCKKIPGVAKLLSLDQAWADAEKLAEKTKAATAAVQDNAKAHTTAAAAITGSANATKTHASATKQLVDYVKMSADSWRKQVELWKEQSETSKVLTKAYNDITAASKQLADIDWAKALPAHVLDVWLAGVMKLVDAYTMWVQGTRQVELAQQQLSGALQPSIDLMKQVNGAITTTESATRKAADAADLYNKAKESGMYTDLDLLKLEQQMLEAKVANGEADQAEIARLKEINAELGTNVEQAKTTQSAWSKMAKEISDAFGTFGRSLKNVFTDLLHGDFSIDKLMHALADLGDRLLDVFLNNGVDAVGGFISKAMNPLMKSLDGLLSKIPLIGDAFEKVLVGADKVTRVSVGGKDTGGDGGSQGPRIPDKSASGSVLGMINLVSGIVDAVGSIGQWIMSMRQETTLNAIEHNTRYTMMYVGERADGGILMQCFKINEQLAWGPMVKILEQIRDHFDDFSTTVVNNLEDIKLALFSIRDAVGGAKYITNAYPRGGDESRNNQREYIPTGTSTLLTTEWYGMWVLPILDDIKSALWTVRDAITGAMKGAADTVSEAVTPPPYGGWPTYGGAPAGVPNGQPVNVNVYGNNILDDRLVDLLVGRISDKLTRAGGRY